MFRLPVPFVALTFACALVAASHAPMGLCGSNGNLAAGILEVTDGKAEATFYVDDRNYVLGNGIWIYQESNGIWTSQGAGVHSGDVTEHNLQRGSACGPGSSGRGGTSECTIPDPSGEICVDVIDWYPDTLVF